MSTEMALTSVCVAVYRRHDEPNVSGLERDLRSALAERDGELVVALNGISASDAGVGGDARTVDLGINRGVAPAWNAAAEAASGDVLVFCNDDVRLGRGALDQLCRVLRDTPEAGVVGPMGSAWDIPCASHVGWVAPDEHDLAVPCDVVSGFLFACRRDTWAAVGGFDEFYAPASWEEVDFCTAVRSKGLQCYVVAGVHCEHEWGVSKRQMPWARVRWNGCSETWRSVHRRNKRHFIEKWSGQRIVQGNREGISR